MSENSSQTTAASAAAAASAAVNGSSSDNSGVLSLQGSTAMRASMTAVIQFLVWPFISVNVFMFHVFRQREALWSEPRYALFTQTLLADVFFLGLTNFVVLTIQAGRLLPVALCVPVCVLMDGLTHLSPTVIVAMCLERYVAVCMPLHHTDVFSPNRTRVVLAVVWLASFLKPLIDLSIFLSYVPESYFTMPTFCYFEIMLLKSWHMALRGNLYILNYLVVLAVLLFCYVSIIVVARRASGDDKKAASKGQRTLLLHLLQLVLCTLETVCPYVEAQILQSGNGYAYIVVRAFNFMAFSIASRAASPLIYGFRDEKFYAAIKSYASCTVNKVASTK
ncbi:odorant receptor 131-2-like [Engraulis encrasicolus]|uniref:odorant receptor 131-2-like n=1 Tax=Engraulis encrasicolus TaxID=184585 RepID=UPI002FD40CBC